MFTIEEVKSIIESVIFVSEDPLSFQQLMGLFTEEEVTPSLVKEAITLLADDYQQRSVELVEVASGYRFQVKQSFSSWAQKLQHERPARYSRAFLETLALIAYKQPITRAEIEDVRGVSISSSILKTLLEREWIKAVGHRDLPGKPVIYATTKRFLDDFNLRSLGQLPTLEELQDWQIIEQKLQTDQNSGKNEAVTE